MKVNTHGMRKVKSRTINNDILRELVGQVNNDWSISECFYQENGVNEPYVLATKNSTLDVTFKVNDNLDISNVKGGSLISYGEWLDLGPTDKELIEGIEELKTIFDKVKEKYQAIIQKSNDIYKIYNNELSYIVANKLQGKFYMYENINKWVSVEIDSREIKRNKFDSLINCIDYLILDNEV